MIISGSDEVVDAGGVVIAIGKRGKGVDGDSGTTSLHGLGLFSDWRGLGGGEDGIMDGDSIIGRGLRWLRCSVVLGTQWVDK